MVEIRVCCVVHHQPAARHDAQQVIELPLDGLEIGVDVGVVELEIVEDQRARPVVDEFGALVEECRVVFIGFDHEEWRVTEPRADVEIARHAADQETRRKTRMIPGCAPACWWWWSCHACRPRRAPSDHAAPRATAIPAPRHEGNAALQQRLDHGLAARHDIADHHHVRCRIELRGVEALHDVDAQRLQLRAHRRIDILVRTGDAMTGGTRDGGDAAHERAADAEYVDVHYCACRRLNRAGSIRLREQASAEQHVSSSLAIASMTQANIGHSVAERRMRASTTSAQTSTTSRSIGGGICQVGSACR